MKFLNKLCSQYQIELNFQELHIVQSMNITTSIGLIKSGECAALVSIIQQPIVMVILMSAIKDVYLNTAT